MNKQKSENKGQLNVLVRRAKGSPLRKTKIYCLCENLVEIEVNGNNSADGKELCKYCGRHITVHFRRHA